MSAKFVTLSAVSTAVALSLGLTACSPFAGDSAKAKDDKHACIALQKTAKQYLSTEDRHGPKNAKSNEGWVKSRREIRSIAKNKKLSDKLRNAADNFEDAIMDAEKNSIFNNPSSPETKAAKERLVKDWHTLSSTCKAAGVELPDAK